MNIDRKWFDVKPITNFSPEFRDDERREIRRALLATLFIVVVGLGLCLLFPGNEHTAGDGFEAALAVAGP
jgi:hypothetical protein